MDWFLYDNGLRHERVKGAPSCPGEFLSTASSLQITKNAFYFNLKSYSFSRYLNVFLDFLVMYKNDLVRMIWLISKFVTPQPGKQTNALQILSNISRRKGSQKMKIIQLIEYSMRNIFLETSCKKVVKKLAPDLLLKNLN